MAEKLDNIQALNETATWIQNALNNSSMALNPNAERGRGIRRAYDEKKDDMNPAGAKPRYVILDNQLLNKKGQGTFVANPFYEIDVCKNGIGKAGKNGPDQFVNIDRIKEAGVELPENADYTMESLQCNKSWSKGLPDESNRPGPKPPMGIPEEALKREYVRFGEDEYIPWGANRFSRFALNKTTQNQEFYGVCDGFTAVTISGLVEKTTFTKINGERADNPTPVGTVVECLRCVVGSGQGMAHTFAIVNRDPASALEDPYTWGEYCFVIDHWYGLQKPTSGEAVVSVYMIGARNTADSKAKQYLEDITQAAMMFDKDAKPHPKMVPNPLFRKLKGAQVSFSFEVKKRDPKVFPAAYKELTKLA